MMVIKKILFVSFIVIIMLGCQSNSNTESSAKRNDLFEIEDAEMPLTSQTNYRIPAPIDLFLMLENSGSKFIGEVLNSPLKRVQYSSTSNRAVNFGIYSTDLAYCSVFGDFQGSLVYFNTAKDIAVDLGLYEGYGEHMAYRINNNLSNIDSLIDISTDSYFQATTFLSDQGMSDIMALMMTGCWIESIYITIESVDHFDIEDPLIERIADQQFLLENLIELIKIDKGSVDLNEELSLLLELQEVYDTLYFNSDDVIITKEQYVSIVNKIKEVRKEFVG